jgi:small subunit ribosomal protein S1
MTQDDALPPATPKPALDAELQHEIDQALGDQSLEQLMDEAAAAEAGPVGPPGTPGTTGAAGSAGEAAPAASKPHAATDLARGRIAAIRGDDVFVELMGLGGKNQGLVPLTQFERPPRLGSVMEFVVDRFDEAEGLVILSREGAVSRASWEQLQRGAVVEARAVAYNKGGLELELSGGVRAFMPASQIDMRHVSELAAYVGQKLPAVVQEIDRRSKKVVISRRLFLEQERVAAQRKIWESLEVGMVRDGVVSSVAEYGAFVDLGGVDGLVHISDMSYSRIDKPGDMVKVGDPVRVKVLKLDVEKKRISLGLKQIAPDPWDAVGTRLKSGETVAGKVLRLADFGAFVEVLPGIEGLLPISEMSWKRSTKPAEVVKVGDTLRMVVLQLDPAKKRLSLSLKQAGGDPWVGAEHTYARNSLVEGTVQSTTEYGAFVEIVPGIEGLVHISELADRRVANVTDVVKVGQKYSFRVLEVDEDNRRIKLSLKAAAEPVAPPPAPVPAPVAAPADPAAAAKAAKAAAKAKKLRGSLKGGMEQHSALGMGLRQLKL